MGRVRPLVAKVDVALMLAITILASAPVAASAYLSKTIAGWTIAASADGSGCFVTRDYGAPNGTMLLLGLDIAGANRLSVLNADWSIKPKTQVVLDFRLSNGNYSKHAAVGIAANGMKGFVTDFEVRFPAHFAASDFLHIQRGEIPVAHLALAGSGAAVAELRRCVVTLRAPTPDGSAAQEPSGRIPRDPFAPEFDRKARKE